MNRLEIDPFSDTDFDNAGLKSVITEFQNSILYEQAFRRAVTKAYYIGRESILKDFRTQRDAIKATLEKHDDHKG